jgi:hypothetical protein
MLRSTPEPTHPTASPEGRTMMTLDQSVRPHPEVVDTELEADETVLLHLEHTTYYSLNSTGTCIWQGIKAGLTLQGISQHLQERFAVVADHADRSVLTFVHALVLQQLVEVSEPACGGRDDGA